MEAHQAQEDARIAAAGGPIRASEIRDATRRIEPPAPGHVHERSVWTLRGRDWLTGYASGDVIHSLHPFRDWQQEPDLRDFVPLTPGARKALAAILDQPAA